MERFQIVLDLFHMFMLERAHGKPLVGPFDLEDDWVNLLSDESDFFTASSKLPVGAPVASSFSSSSVSSSLCFCHL